MKFLTVITFLGTVVGSTLLIADENKPIVDAEVNNKSAYDLMEAVDKRDRGQARMIESEVVLIDKNSRQSQRSIKVLNKMFDEDEKSITFITSPSRLKGTGFLVYDWDDPVIENEAWIYLPDLRKVTRLSTSNRADYFLGSDFTYGDLERLEVQDYQYQYADEKVSEQGFFVIDAAPVSDRKNAVIEKYGYQKIRYWIDIEINMIVKAKYWLKNSGWIKYYKAEKIKMHDNILVAEYEQMVMTKQNKKVHTTVISVEDVEMDYAVDDGLFTTYGLESDYLK